MSDSAKCIIKDNAVVADDLKIATAQENAGTVCGARVALPLALWLAQVGAGETAISTLSPLPAVWLAPDDDPAHLAEALHGDLSRIPLIAVQFPRFVDGRGYSTGYLLRNRFGYSGELRAFGDLGRDQLWPLQRVGFNSFDLRAGTDLIEALAAFTDFPERYQTSTDEAQPLFRRREATHV